MKLLTILAIICLLGASFAYAEGWRGKHRGKHAEKVVQALDLTDEQKEPVQEILREQMEKGRALRQSIRQQAEPEIKALMAETRTKLAGVLDETQLQKYDEFSAKRYEKMQRRFGKHDAGSHNVE